MPSISTHHYNTRPASHRVSSSTTEFRGSTNPDEDWTKISDLAERRRIQNRIAQRNYRKKLKRRLEDLERRAASRSLSPNGEDTDGRSTRESSAEGIVSTPPSSEPHLADSSRENYLPPLGAYTTSGTYAPVYRTASSPYSSAPYYPPITQAEPLQDYTTTPHYLYSFSQPTLSSMVEATCGPSSVSSTSSEHSYLPLPSARLSNGSSYSTVSASPPEFSSPKTPDMVYEENVSPFYLPYSGLSDPPTDPSFFSPQYYHDDQHSSHSGPPSPPMLIKSETKH